MSWQIAIAAASTALSAFQSYKQGQYERGIARYNARVQENAAIREQNASIERARDAKLRTRALVAHQQAALAAKGVDLGSGSSLDIIQGSDYFGNIDLFRIRQNGDMRSEARRQQAALDIAQGNLAARRGRNRAIGTLLTGAMKVAGKWYKGGGDYSFDSTPGALSTAQRTAMMTPYKPVKLY